MKAQSLTRTWFFNTAFGTLAGMALAVAAATAHAAGVQCSADGKTCQFTMVRNAGLPATCLPYARATVRILRTGATEIMKVQVSGLPANTEFDLFVTQVPKAPFGLAWYQGDLETDAYGLGYQTYEGRFNRETFIVAIPGAVPLAPAVHSGGQFPDAVFGQTLPVGPIHTFHLGLWFNSPADAIKAGCPGAVTPFNGEHNAGVQVLNTGNFANAWGPLRFIKP